MKELKRYDLEWVGGYGCSQQTKELVENELGDLVKYEDYKSELDQKDKEIQRLKNKCNQFKNKWEYVSEELITRLEEIKKLESENKRLNRALELACEENYQHWMNKRADFIQQATKELEGDNETNSINR